MPAPLYESLKRLAGESGIRLDMPGHHGGRLPVEALADAALDVTENGRTGDLFGSGGDAIEEAELLWARRLGFDSCLFLTGGSTQGVHAGLALLAGAGGHVALDRGSHRSAYHALALLDITPHFLTRPWSGEEGVTGPIQPDEVEKTLKMHPEIKTVCITSPTYYGVLSDVPALARVCHRYGARLMVDGAHGAHLPFLGYEGFRCADVVVTSAHKTLPALGQSALLFANGYSMAELRRVGSVYGSSSPSYLLMASMDLARAYMENEGGRAYTKTASVVEVLRRRFPSLRPGRWALDPTRLVLRCADGFALAEFLRGRGIYPEMADSGHVVFIFTCADTAAEAHSLAEALEQWEGWAEKAGACPCPPEPPSMAMTPRQALFARREQVALEQSLGRISAGQLAPYPPGIPVVAPGEIIDKKHLAYLREIGYNSDVTEAVLLE